MMRHFHLPALWFLAFAGAMCSLPVFAQQQQQQQQQQQKINPNAPFSQPDKPPSSQPDKNCNWKATKGSSGPWKSTSTCEQSQPPSDENTPALTPDARSVQQKQQTPQQANPFPEAQSRKAQDAANPSAPATKPDVSSSHVDLNRLNAPDGSVSRISDGAGGYIHDPQMAKHDDKVGAFYLQSRDYKGAYDRYLEATRVAPEDGNAVFGLAESARGLHHTKEAVTNYLVYLDAFPDGKKAKDARKALAGLGSPQKK